MKATYFFSQKQKQVMGRIANQNGEHYHSKHIDGVEFTEVQTFDESHESLWDDAKVVKVREGLPVDEWYFEHVGKKSAKI